MPMAGSCALCTTKASERPAVARFWDDQDREWLVCRKCLTLVLETDLEFEFLDDIQPTDESLAER